MAEQGEKSLEFFSYQHMKTYIDENIVKFQRYVNDVNSSYEINENTIKTTEQVINVLQTATIDASTIVSDLILKGREKNDYEIAESYLEKKKYGLEGSDGSFRLNYAVYVNNHHQLVSLCCASKKNPFSRLRRLLSLINKISFALLLAIAVNVLTSKHQRNEFSSRTFISVSFIISLIIGAYGFLLENIATCYICNKTNICVNPMRGCSMFVLVALAVPSIAACGISIYILINYPTDHIFVVQTVLSVLLDFLSFFYLGIINWMLVSWRGCLCLPMFPYYCCCCTKSKDDNTDIVVEGFPPRFLPLLGCWPCRFALNLCHLGERTYLEDKVEFGMKYPGRVAVDDFREDIGRV